MSHLFFFSFPAWEITSILSIQGKSIKLSGNIFSSLSFKNHSPRSYISVDGTRDPFLLSIMKDVSFLRPYIYYFINIYTPWKKLLKP